MAVANILKTGDHIVCCDDVYGGLCQSNFFVVCLMKFGSKPTNSLDDDHPQCQLELLSEKYLSGNKKQKELVWRSLNLFQTKIEHIYILQELNDSFDEYLYRIMVCKQRWPT